MKYSESFWLDDTYAEFYHKMYCCRCIHGNHGYPNKNPCPVWKFVNLGKEGEKNLAKQYIDNIRDKFKKIFIQRDGVEYSECSMFVKNR